MLKLLLILIAAVAAVNAQHNEAELRETALNLAREIIMVDTHIDLPLHLFRRSIDVVTESAKNDIDLPRAVRGGLNAAFMAIYTSPRSEGVDAFSRADTLIDLVEELHIKYPDKFAPALTAADVENNFKSGLFSLPMGMENGSPLEGSLDKLRYFYGRGIRYITLCHVKDNHISDSSGDTTNTWNGLSPFGEEAVKEMNALGMMIDVSHVSDSAFFDVLKISNVPVIASHSGCRVYTPGYLRNMSDEMMKKLADNGGIINIYFGTTLLDNAIREQYEEWRQKRAAYLKEHLSGETQFEAENPVNFGSISDVVKHIDHAVKVAGIDHVGIGSDFDGVDLLAPELKDASMYPNLIYELLKLGYSGEDIRKIFGGNLLRVWKIIQQSKGS